MINNPEIIFMENKIITLKIIGEQ